LAWPVGQLYANGRAFVPNVRQTLYSDVIVALAAEPHQAAVGPDDDKASMPVARGLPRSWDEIAPGHLVIAQESLEYGWWEAIVIDRKDDMLTLRFRDYPRLPKFFRHCSAIALMSPASDQVKLRRVGIGSGCDSGPGPCPLNGTTSHHPYNLEVQSWTRRLRAFAR
jgi:hypothetical protein